MLSPETRNLLHRAFSPSAPITSEEFFLGRFDQLVKAVDAINQRGQHIVIFGERGVGKTSFANIVSTKISNVVVSKVTCTRGDTFNDIWRRALARVVFTQEARGFGFTAKSTQEEMQLDMFVPEAAELGSAEVQRVFEQLNVYVLFVFDEFDSVSDKAVLSNFADLIKNLSDNSPRVTIAIVGIAEDLSGLVGEHPSIERCLKQIKLPRMSAKELTDVVDKGLELLKLAILPAVKQKIIFFSSGFPHFTHLLSLYAAEACLQEGSAVILDKHYRVALDKAIDDVNQSIMSSYQLATIEVKKKKSKFGMVLNACALAKQDEYTTFAIKDVVHPYNKISGEKATARDLVYNIKKLCEPDRGSILVKVGDSSRNVRFRFNSPLMRVYLSMKIEQSNGDFQSQLFSYV